MKTSLAACACVLLLVVSAGAIPQTITAPNVFLHTAGVSFEEFASDPAAWDAAGLKGTWQAHGDTLTLTDSAAVFGLAAEEITAQRQGGRVQSFRVVFRPQEKRAGGKTTELMGQVMANVQAFTGSPGTSASAGLTKYTFKAVGITVRAGSKGEVVVDFQRE